MPVFIGFNTIGQPKKFTLTDFDLVKRDFANAINIQQGSLPGRPSVGTTIWSYIFENQTPDIIEKILAELQRVASQDPRLYIADAQVYPQINGMLIEMKLQIVPGTTIEQLSLFFDEQTRQASFA